MLDSQEMDRKGRMVLVLMAHLTAKTREKVAELSSTSNSEHIWVMKEIVWTSRVCKAIPESTYCLPSASQ